MFISLLGLKSQKVCGVEEKQRDKAWIKVSRLIYDISTCYKELSV